MVRQAGFFDAEERLRWLSEAGDPLERLAQTVDFELFRPELEAALVRSDRSRGGRPPYDAVLMFRLLVLQALYTLSDEQMEYQLRDRLSFMRFVGLALHDPVPDAKTIWLYREQLTRTGALAKLFARFDSALKARGYLAMGGQIIDATVVQARPPRLSAAEKAVLREGGTPKDWSKAKERQIDRDGRWTVKRGGTARPPEDGVERSAEERQRRQGDGVIAVPVFGYKNHVCIDRQHGFIRRFTITDAARHDGHELAAVLDRSNTASAVWADAAYRSAENLALLEAYGFEAQIQRRKPPGRPMPRHIARGNATRASIRRRVEHVFATEKCQMGLIIRCVGLIRAKARITLANLAYNMKRLVWIEGRGVPA